MKGFIVTIVALSLFAPTTKAADPAPSDDAAKVYQAYESLQPPMFDPSKQGDQQYIQTFVKQRDQFIEQKTDAGKAFYLKYPNDPRAAAVRSECWMNLARSGKTAEVLDETNQWLEKNANSPDRVGVLFMRAVVYENGAPGAGDDKALAAVEEFIKAAPKDERGAELLASMAMQTQDPAKRAALQHRIIDQYPDSQSAKLAQGSVRQTDAIGKPFDLSFTDAISGKAISMADLKGKVVVIDFWATWCGPCVGEMPNMKELYSKYKDKNVQFIGVDLDQPEAQGGLTKLKDFVKENAIEWPQYYQGKGWGSEFSMSWGIDSIPTVFVVDTNGNLYSVQARGQLETMIPQLLDKASRS